MWTGYTSNYINVAVETTQDLHRLRISSIEPTTIAGEIVRMIADSSKLCKHLHIPIQSGDDTILKHMRRKYDVKEFTDFIDFVHKTVPDIGIGTDVMVGFPHEDEQSFLKTKTVLGDLPVSYYHVFTYSDREGTSSYRVKEKVPYEIKKKRTSLLIEQGKRKKRTFFDNYKERTLSVLFEQRNKDGMWTGYTSNYINVAVETTQDLHNQIIPVQITDADDRQARGMIEGA
jgi:threonylcarbamoyladenosine tRNA methylthiotransferase MtaB